MKMNVFIDIVCGLIPEPKNWDAVFKEYQSLIKDNKSNIILSLLKEIAFTENKIFLINSLCYALSLKYNADLATQLNYLMPKFKYAPTSGLNDELKRTISATKSMAVKLKEKKAQLSNIQKQSQSDTPKPTDWDQQFIYLSKFMGVKMSAENTSVSEYCYAIEYLKEATKENAKQ